MRNPPRYFVWFAVLVPWAAMLMALTWDASFESTPSNADLVSEGDDRIRDLKLEIRDRLEEEVCFGTTGATSCPSTGDNGFAREGSARAFFATAQPTTLNNPAATSILAAAHDGRLWFDDDGPDNVNANNDDNRLSIYDGTAGAPQVFALGALGMVDFVTTAPVAGNALYFDGTNWVPINAGQLLSTYTRTVFDYATIDNETFTNVVCAACTVAGVPDFTGGTDTNNYPEVTIPASPTGVVWDISVIGHVNAHFTTTDGTSALCRLHEDINDANVFTLVRSTSLAGSDDGVADVPRDESCYFHYILRGATVGSAYAYRVSFVGPDFGGEDFTIDPHGGSTSELHVIATIR